MYALHPTLQPGPPYTGGTRNILGLVIEMRHVFEGRLPASNMLQKIREKGRLKLKLLTQQAQPGMHRTCIRTVNWAFYIRMTGHR